MTSEFLGSVPGGSALLSYYEGCPSFHDAEVLCIHLNRSGSSVVRIHAFETNGEIADTGHYKTEKHCIIAFEFTSLTNCDLSFFNEQNVLSELALEKMEDEYRLRFSASYGVEGFIYSSGLGISLEQAMPADSMYSPDVMQS